MDIFLSLGVNETVHLLWSVTKFIHLGAEVYNFSSFGI